jgi:hypothetical protein
MSEKFVSRRQRNRRNTLILGFIAIVALGFGALFYQQNKAAGDASPQALAKIVQQEGKIRIKRDHKQLSGDVGLRLQAGDRIQTMPNSEMKIVFQDPDMSLKLEDETILILGTLEKGKKVMLLSGNIVMDVQALPEQHQVIIESINAVATIRRPGYYLGRYQGLQTDFQVKKGELHIRRMRDGFETVLAPGETYCCQPEEENSKIEFQFDDVN